MPKPEGKTLVEVFTDLEWNDLEGPDGLYPGQLKPPIDFTDIDIEEEPIDGPPTLLKDGKDCKT